MKIHVQFYAQLRDLVGMRELDLELAEGATIRDLLNRFLTSKKRLMDGGGDHAADVRQLPPDLRAHHGGSA